MSRENMMEAFKVYCLGHLAKHKANINNILDNGVGVADHPDILGTMAEEMSNVAKYDEMLEMANKHF